MKLVLKILLIVLWTGLAAGAGILMGFANQNHDSKPCTGLDICVDYGGKEPLITSYDLKQQLSHRFGPFQKKMLDELDIEAVLAFLKKIPVIGQADAHATIEGKLVIEVRQCNPLVRLITPTGENYYLDDKGKVLPVNPNYPSRVVVANGFFDVPLKAGNSLFQAETKKSTASLKTLYDIHSLATLIAADSLLSVLIEQLYIRPDGSILLATKAGSHTIIFGDSTRAAEKFSNLKAFYKHGLPKTGWNKYRTINLTYKNQVVCTK